jgi:hypothetical protein
MQAVGLNNKSNSVSPIRMQTGGGSAMKMAQSKSPVNMISAEHPRNQSAMAIQSGIENNSGIKTIALGVNNSNIMANGSSSRKNPLIGDALNNSSGNDASTKKMGQPRQSIATHRSNSSNVSNSIKQAAN